MERRLDALEKRVTALELSNPAYAPKGCTYEEYRELSQRAFEEALALRERQ